jgi:hypothetical protein
MDVSEVRRRLKMAIDRAKRADAARRAAADAAGREYESFLDTVATPVFRMFASALTGDGLPFHVFTPAGTIRLASDKSGEDYIELALDTSRMPPEVIGRASRGRGRRMITTERPVAEGKTVSELTEEDVLGYLLSEIDRFVV